MTTGLHQNYIGAHQHREYNKKPWPYGIKTIPEIFEEAVYYTCLISNKVDANFLPDKVDDIFMGKKDWTERIPGQPFFAQVQFHNPHRLFVKDSINPVNPDTVTIPGCYPVYPIIRSDWAAYIESVQECDRQVGRVLNKLEKDGDLKNTVVVLFGDHGRPHLRDKQFLYEGGLEVPLIISTLSRLSQELPMMRL